MNHRDQINKAFDEKVIKNLDKTKRAAALACFGKLIETTPVDTGRAKSNWWMDINRASAEIRSEDNAAAATAQAQNVTSKETQITDQIIISNNLPYIKRLDDGYSQKAPAGMVNQSVQYGRAVAKEFAKRLK